MITLQQIKSFLNPFKGATSSANGIKGLVPAPKINQIGEFYLNSNGEWKLLEQGWKGLPVGFRCNWDGTIPPENFLFEDGQTLNRVDYPILWKFANDNEMVVTKEIWDSNKAYGLFNDGDGSTTFQMPYRNNGFFERFTGGNAGALGYQQNEGLPNITGTFRAVDTAGGGLNVSGAIQLASGYDNGSYGGGGGRANSRANLSFDASLSSPIYGASSHVTPINIATKSIRKYK